MKRWLVAAFLLMLATRPVSARDQLGYLWSTSELFEKSDLVVIGERTITRDTGRETVLEELTPGVAVRELASEFTPHVILKGGQDTASVVMRHYRLTADCCPRGMVNGPTVLRFATAPHTTYLLFLRRDLDGVYRPTSGHVTPEDSVFELRPAG